MMDSFVLPVHVKGLALRQSNMHSVDKK
jgi:hypothetical protein